MPMIVTPESIKKLRDMGVLPITVKNDTLWLSMRSMSLNEEMRFRLHNGLLGQTTEWPITAEDCEHKWSSFEFG